MQDMLAISENKDVKTLMDILIKEKMNTQLAELVDTLDYIDKLENKLDKITGELVSVKEQMSKMQENPIKRAIGNIVQSMETKLNKAKNYLDGIKNSITDEAKQVVNAVKQKGIFALNSTLNFLHIKDSLKVVQNTLVGAETQLNKAIKELALLEQRTQRLQKSSVLNDLKSKKEQINVKEPDIVDKSKKKDVSL